MWQKPAQVTDPLAKIIAYQAANSQLLKLEVAVEGDDTIALLLQWLHDTIEIRRTSSSTRIFARRIGTYVVAEARKLEQRVSVLEELHAHLQNLSSGLAPQYGQRLAKAIDIVLSFFVSAVIVAAWIGDEAARWCKWRKTGLEENSQDCSRRSAVSP